MQVPENFVYRWESVGDGYLCALCMNHIPRKHSWRAHSDIYGDVYICPSHLYKIQRHGVATERLTMWLAVRAAALQSLREKHEHMTGIKDAIDHDG